MHIFRKIYTAIYFIFTLLVITSFRPEEITLKSSEKLILQFESYIGNEVLKMDSVLYKNELGQTYNVSKFKYYISNIHLLKTDGKEYNSNEYFLINEEISGSKQIILNDIEAGEYSSMSFIIGVDSLHNCSGIQSGSLDPVNGMFWAWNTGYIFLKLEGRAAESKSTGHIFEFHIGGYKAPSNCIRKITFNFIKDNLKMADNNVHSIKIKADVEQILKSPTTIDFSKLSSVTDFNNATLIADNYADMFSITEIK